MRCQRIVKSSFFAYSFCFAAAVFAISGCGGQSGPERVVVYGTVTHQGEPIARGQVLFEPAAGSMVPVAWAKIVDGRYTANVHGGVCPGTYKVQFEAYGKAADPQTNTLSNKFGERSSIQVTIESGVRKVEKNFELKE